MASIKSFKLDYGVLVDTDLLLLTFAPGTGEQTTFRADGRSITVSFPKDFSFAPPRNQEWANHVLQTMLRHRAKQTLPLRLASFARRDDMRYNRVTIKNVRTCWGSCSGYGNINLSLWLMLAPEPLVDYVICHELSHLDEMNHGPRFWARLDSMLGGAGKGKALEARMKAFARRLWQSPGLPVN